MHNTATFGAIENEKSVLPENRHRETTLRAQRYNMTDLDFVFDCSAKAPIHSRTPWDFGFT